MRHSLEFTQSRVLFKINYLVLFLKTYTATLDIHGGPAKMRPTYIFDGKI